MDLSNKEVSQYYTTLDHEDACIPDPSLEGCTHTPLSKRVKVTSHMVSEVIFLVEMIIFQFLVSYSMSEKYYPLFNF